jgi:hypothetical protein
MNHQKLILQSNLNSKRGFVRRNHYCNTRKLISLQQQQNSLRPFFPTWFWAHSDPLADFRYKLRSR